MSEINFLPETIVKGQAQKQRGRRGFYAAFLFLAIVSTSSFAVQIYQSSLEAKEKDLKARITNEETAIQSLKNTEGLYRSLKVKSSQLAEILEQRQNYPLLASEIKNMASTSNVSLQKYSLGQDQKFELTAIVSSYSDLVNFLQFLDYDEAVLNFVKQNEEKGYIEFGLNLNT